MRARAALAWALSFCFLLALWVAPALAQVRTSIADTGDAGVDAGPLQDTRDAGAEVAPVAAGTWRTPDHDALLGRPVRFVEVVLLGPTTPDPEYRRLIAGTNLPQLHRVKLGEAFTQEVARRAMTEVLETGDFADAKVSASPEGDGVRVVVEVTIRKVLSDVVLIVAGGRVDKEELLRDAELGKGKEVSGDRLPFYRKKIQAHLDRRGYPRATVSMRFTADPQRRNVVLLTLFLASAGANVAREVTFDFLRADGKPDLTQRSRMRTVGKAVAAYTFKKKSVLDEDKLEADDLELRTRLQSVGFFDAEVSHEIDAFTDAGAALHVRIVLGPAFTLRFEGNDHYDADALRSALGIADESDRSAVHLGGKVREFYVQRGFLDAEVDPKELGGPNDLVHTLLFRVYEKKRVSVRTRRYPCFSSAALANVKLETAPRTVHAIGTEIDSFLEEELPGEDLLRNPRPNALNATIGGGTMFARNPLELDPSLTFAPETYGRAVDHVRDLYRADGYLEVEVGPLAVVRRRCKKSSPPGECRPVEGPKVDEQAICAYDARGLPLPLPEPDPAETCVPDPDHHVECESQVDLRIPVKLGPRSILYEVTFSGVRAQRPRDLFDVMGLKVGKPASTVKLEDARRKLLDYYREQGFAFAEARFALEFSTDHTRVRARFDVTESERVLVRGIIVRGLERTDEGLLRRRLALEVCKDERTCEPYRTSLVRRTEERIGTLGVFSSVSVGLENPYLPEKWKNVVIEVSERVPQVTELRVGFSSGQGIRLGGEYGHRNIFGRAISFSLLAELSYLPTFFITEFIRDPVLEENFVNVLGDPGFGTRTATRITGSLQFPETGLGPLFRGVLDGVFVHDLQRDYYVRKFAAIPSVTFTPERRLRFSAGQSFEFNAVRIFQGGNLDNYLSGLAQQGQLTADRAARLLVPDGQSLAFAQKVTAAWDRRDNSLDAMRGTFVGLTLEHVDAFPVSEDKGITAGIGRESHFLKVVQTVSGYIPIYKRLRLALSVRAGANLQITRDSVTYPDRLFFLGGADSMRAWYQTTFMPQDDADQVQADRNKPATVANPLAGQPNQPDRINNPDKFSETSRPVRGGNLLFNPRAELRIPLSGALETVGFLDLGNLWTEVAYPFDKGQFPLRYAVGTGLRVQTPVFPIVFDIGFNPSRRYFERSWAFNFAIGLF